MTKVNKRIERWMRKIAKLYWGQYHGYSCADNEQKLAQLIANHVPDVKRFQESSDRAGG